MRTLLLSVLSMVLFLPALWAQAPQDYLKEIAPQVQAIVLEAAPDQKKAKQLFRTVKAHAENGDADAACDLGILYKDGIGCNLNFNKARKWFERGQEGGSRKAAYSLGYLYLKGLGNIPQDYKRAVAQFKITDWPMAIHWLAKCYYHGLGVSQDKAKAMELLRGNYLGNSKVLLAQWEYDRDHELLPPAPLQDVSAAFVTAPKKLGEHIEGTWSGTWQLMDWSGKRVMREVPLKISISGNGKELHTATVTTSEASFTGEVLVNGGELVFPNMTVDLRKRYTDRVDEVMLGHRFTSLRFDIKADHRGVSLTGNLESQIAQWSEPGAPSRFTMTKVEDGIPNKAFDAFAEQGEHFIKVYPNPFEEDLLLHYTLDSDADVSIHISDYYRPQQQLKSKGAKQKKGKRTVSFGSLSELKSGLYLVQMDVNGTLYSRIVIKK